jgi:NAD-dependent SIR2 family protein deacetylase
LVTQNVDCLHRRAGSNKVIDLHGRLDRVICMDCQHIVWRSDFQVTLQARNPQSINWRAQVLPDGDARLEEDGDSLFEIPTCEKCNGTLIPDVIFYGGHVPKSRVELAYRHLEYADSVLVVGSSLRVYSGFRFIRKAKEIGLPMYAINPGIMRGSEMFDMIVDDEALAVLPTLLEQMSS